MTQFDLVRIKNETGIHTLEHHPVVESTSDRAIEWIRRSQTAQSFPELPLLVLTDQQTSGRGQFDRRWISNAGSLTFSLVLPSIHFTCSTLVPLTVGLAVCQSIEQIATTRNLKLKWPNDIFVGERKLGGILIEQIPWSGAMPCSWTEFQVASKQVLIIGIGINVNQPVSLESPAQASAPGGFQSNPISLFEHLGQSTDLSKLLIEIVNAIRLSLPRTDIARVTLTNECHRRMVFRDGDISIILPTGECVRGRYCGIGSSGELLVERDGTLVRITSAKNISWY
jgi:BirA family transcriptional regulator, biotin operon repressor / biotin---[acetyl-CoA-carboxylase] ligase